jgi:putative redox protein
LKTVTVQSQPDHPFTQRVTAGRHTFASDEPAAAGGEDLGPGPYELLLGALGACTSMTLLMYARRHSWDLRDVSVQLTHDRVHSRDVSAEATERIDVIRSAITLHGDLSDEQRGRLLEIASRCPVHKTLRSPIRLSEELVP